MGPGASMGKRGRDQGEPRGYPPRGESEGRVARVAVTKWLPTDSLAVDRAS